MQSMVCFPHPSWPVSILTSGQEKRTTESLASYQVFHQCGVGSMHPSWSSCSVSWGWYRTSDCHPFSRPGLLSSPWTVWLVHYTNIQQFLDKGPHVVIHMGRHMSVTLLKGCLIHLFYLVFDQGSFAQIQVTVCKQVLPFEQKLPGLLLLQFWPFMETLKVQGLQDPSFLWFGIRLLGVLFGWTTGGTCFAGTTCPTTAFVGICIVQVLKLHRQIGTLEDPRCNSP